MGWIGINGLAIVSQGSIRYLEGMILKSKVKECDI